MNSDELMAEIEQLKDKAAQHEEDQTLAKQTEAVLRSKLELLENKLKSELGIESWEEAHAALPHYAGQVREALQAALKAAKDAGIDVD